MQEIWNAPCPKRRQQSTTQDLFFVNAVLNDLDKVQEICTTFYQQNQSSTVELVRQPHLSAVITDFKQMQKVFEESILDSTAQGSSLEFHGRAIKKTLEQIMESWNISTPNSQRQSSPQETSLKDRIIALSEARKQIEESWNTASELESSNHDFKWFLMTTLLAGIGQPALKMAISSEFAYAEPSVQITLYDVSKRTKNLQIALFPTIANGE